MSSEAKQWLVDTFHVSRETLSKLDLLWRATLEANEQQNLISKSTIDDFWNRHVIDSAQLLLLTAAGAGPRSWIDLGSGAGFPGLVVALLSDHRVALSEERRKRADHLEAMIGLLGLGDRVVVLRGSVALQRTGPYSIISARAFAPLDRLFALSHHLSSKETLWVLPKGRSAASELEAASRTWQGSFRIEPSITDSEGAIILATGVEPRRRR